MLRKTNHLPARLGAGARPVLVVVIDTEGEFDWTKPFDRASVGTSSIAGQPLMHERVCDRLGIVPTYVMSHSGALERIRLSPEAANGAELRRLNSALHGAGCEMFSRTYHTPSMVPGHTPYVRTDADLQRFIATVHDYCTWFSDELGGEFMSVTGLAARLQG